MVSHRSARHPLFRHGWLAGDVIIDLRAVVFAL
jgi:hypothetical protein